MIRIPSWLLSTPVQLKKFKGLDEDGRSMYDPALNLMCRLQANATEVVKINGDTVYYNSVIFLDYAGDDIKIGSMFIISGKQFLAKKIDTFRNPDGTINHVKVFVE